MNAVCEQGKYDWIAGTIEVGAPAPELWPETPEAFYIKPYDEAFSNVSRVVIHETVHHWQLCSWPFMMLSAIETLEGRQFNSLSRYGRQSARELFEGNGIGFSPWHLHECWARFWDLHMRGVQFVLQEVGLENVGFATQGKVRGEDGMRPYTGTAFDFAMTSGVLGSEYEKPYLWLMEELQRVIDSDESSAVNVALARGFGRVSNRTLEIYQSICAVVIFPMCAHSSFKTINPSAAFRAMVCSLLNSVDVHKTIIKAIKFSQELYGKPDIETMWVFSAKSLHTAIFSEIEQYDFLSEDDLDVITKSGLHMDEYPSRNEDLSNRVDDWFGEAQQLQAIANGKSLWWASLNPQKHVESELRNLAMSSTDWLFTYPGVRSSRDLLSRSFPPKKVIFEDKTFAWS